MPSKKEQPSSPSRVVEYKDFTKAALARMLAEADAGARFAAMPLHKRRLATEDDDEDDEMTQEADEDRVARADLVETTRPGNAPEVDEEDLPRNVVKRYAEKPKKGRGRA
jgi:hypothetical protein